MKNGDVRLANILFLKDGGATFIDFDYTGNHVYPEGYSTDLEDTVRHPDASENKPIKGIHDLFSLISIFKEKIKLSYNGEPQKNRLSSFYKNVLEIIETFDKEKEINDTSYIPLIKEELKLIVLN